jgi:hypothetical protein
MNTNNCISYKNINYLKDLVFPFHIFINICKSYDKTTMFFIALFRCFIYMLITNLYYETYGNNIIFYLLIIFIIINILILYNIMLKEPIHDTYKKFHNNDEITYYNKFYGDINDTINFYPEQSLQ